MEPYAQRKRVTRVLEGAILGNMFFEASTRTRVSFGSAFNLLGGEVRETAGFESSALVKGESLQDTARVLSGFSDVICMRHPQPGSVADFAACSRVPVMNGGDGANEHPTQALLDSFSIREKYGDLKGKNVVIVGDILHSRVALSNIFCLQKLGANVKVCGPLTLIPKHINSLGVEVITNLKEALNWCDVAMMLRIQLERQDLNYFPSLREYSMRYGINKKILDKLTNDIVIMHPGPINRGVELSSDVADSNQSIILNQVENGVAIRMAVLYLLALKKNN